MFQNLPIVTRSLLLANIVVYLLQQWLGDALLVHFALWPLGPDQAVQTDSGVLMVGFRLWQLVSYAFLHGSVTHIFFNMLALYMFGGTIERTLGTRRYAIYYLICLLAAALAQLAVMRWLLHSGFFPTLGASGAIFGLLLAFGVMYPREKIYFMLIPVPIPAWLFVILYALAELLFGVTQTLSGVAHFAHLGGMLGGYVVLQYWRGRLPVKPAQLLWR
ncbi:rhomboid family intramembrane serine protease [Frateuria aurantia]